MLSGTYGPWYLQGRQFGLYLANQRPLGKNFFLPIFLCFIHTLLPIYAFSTYIFSLFILHLIYYYLFFCLTLFSFISSYCVTIRSQNRCIIATNQWVLAGKACQHESWLLLRLDMLFSVTYPTHFYILGHNFSTIKATGAWRLFPVYFRTEYNYLAKLNTQSNASIATC